MKSERKVDQLYEVKGMLRVAARPFVWTAKTYAQGLRSFVPLTKRAVLALRGERVVKVKVRPTRNYEEAKLMAGVALYRSVHHYVETIKQIGLGTSDEIILGHLRAISIALVSQDFPTIYDQAVGDARLTESERDLIASATLDMQVEESRLL